MATVVKKDNQQKDTLEIKTRSIEQTLLPLIKQISTLVEHRSESNMREPIATPAAWARVGQALSVAVERFVTVGETIADDHSEVRQGMYEACKEARQAGAAIEHLCEAASEETVADRGAVVRASRALLASVTRVLLLADIVVVKQLLLAKDKVQRSLGRLESVSNFTEFVKAFSQFGAEMVELAHLTGDRQNDLKDERRRAQMAAARQVLERSTMMLLTSSKACLRHPDSVSARENRDTIFCQMRRAMDLIHYVVKDGVLSCSGMQSPTSQNEEWETDRTTVSASIRHLEHLVELCRLTDHEIPHRSDNNTGSQIGPALDALLERSHDFTDSPYTSHEHRQKILVLLDSLADRVSHLIEAYEMCATDIDADVDSVLEATRALWLQLWRCTADQAGELTSLIATGRDAIHAMRSSPQQHTSPTSRRPDQTFHDCIEHTLEICKLVRHVALTESLQVAARFAETNLRVYGPQVVTAWRTLQEVPQSQIAAENLEVFSDMYQWLASDVTTTAREVLENSSGHRQSSDKQVYLSLPRPGKHGTTSKPLKAVRLDSEEQAKIAKSGLEMKMISSEMDAETEKWQEAGAAAMEENNDIVKRAKNMSAMAFSMYQFTRGEGSLKTTQDLFTQAEYFAEEANRLYKVVRQFSYQVPGGANKKELLENLDRVPTFVQQLQFTVKDPTVGKAATFIKVDNVIQETKNLMNVISKVVTQCFECASKYKLELGGPAEVAGAGAGAGGSMGCSGGGNGSGMGGGGGGGEGSL